MKRLTVKQILRIKELHKKKLSDTQIAKKIGCVRGTVWYWLNNKIKTK